MTQAASTTPTPSTGAGVVGSLRLAAMDIKLAHSVFALPFAILAAFMASPVSREGASAGSWRTFGIQLAIVIVCMVCARTWAMLVNRLADRTFDAKNARTAKRVIASGKLDPARARIITLGAGVAFVGACTLFYVLQRNYWPMALSVPVLGWIALYSYTKRFTALCHVFLGGALGVSPLAAALAVEPGAIREIAALWWFGGFVVLWVAGFDVLYAIQDIEFDRAEGLFSIPSRLGLGGAIWMARAFHVAAFAMLVIGTTAEPRFSLAMDAAVGVVGALLIFEHVVVARRGKAGIPMAFFTVNGIVSVLLGIAGCIDLFQ